MPIGEKPKLQGRIDPSMRSEKHFVEHPSSVDSCRVQQELSITEEPGEDGNTVQGIGRVGYDSAADGSTRNPEPTRPS